ncbi:MAG TPA: NAD(P)-dependent oxidoreductase [Stellaceae bacterium]|nr:NAD(P)-dependent oxidoreductase [Stellaceae bacterium]
MPGPNLLPVLLTGAAGKLGTWLREHLAKRPGGVRSTDIRAFGPSIPGETITLGDLADASIVERLVKGTSAVVHFGAIAGEDTFERILQSNIIGTQNVFDAARRHDIKRIVYASSIHTVGFYPTAERIDADAPPRPDSYYAVSKVFGESLARLYVEKAGMDIACLRIGVALQEPQAPRNLWTWLSVSDLCRLVDACLDAPPFGFSVTYGISNNRRNWWDNRKSAVDYRPMDDAERFAGRLMPDGDTRDPEDPGVKFHGGPFVALGFGQRPA